MEFVGGRRHKSLGVGKPEKHGRIGENLADSEPNSQSNVPFCFLKRESLPHLIIVHPKRRQYVKKYIDLKSIWEPSPLIHKRRRSTPRKKIQKICVISQRGCVCVSSTRGFLSATEGLCFYSCFYTAIFVCVSSFHHVASFFFVVVHWLYSWDPAGASSRFCCYFVARKIVTF